MWSYKFGGWKLKNTGNKILDPNMSTFQMPAHDVILYAHWVNITQGSSTIYGSVPITETIVQWVSRYDENGDGVNEVNTVLDTAVVSGFTSGTNQPIFPAYSKEKPTRGNGWVFDGWESPVKEAEKNADGKWVYTIVAKWAQPDVLEDPIEPKKPGGGDGIADYHQFHVTYEVQNGTLTFDGKTGKEPVKTVITRRDDAGNPAGDLGKAKLAKAHLATSNPDANYGNAKWYVKATGTEGLGTETEAPAVGTVVPYHKDGTTYTVVYSTVKVTAVPNGGSWQSTLPSNWKDAEPSGNKVSELANGSVKLPVAVNITKTGKTLVGWKADDAAKTLYAPGAEVKPDKDLPKDLTVTAQWAGLEITKTADPTSGVKVGDTINYKITVKNTGDVDLTGVVVSDSMKDKVTLTNGSDWTIGDLAHGASEEITYTYKVADADVKAGNVLNTATVKGKGPNGTEPSAKTDEVEVKALGEPKLSVEKKVNGSATAMANVGETVTYTITVTNSGNGNATGILLTDAFSGAGSLVWTGSDPTAVEFDVAANDSVTFTATYEVVEGDKGQKITNSAVLPSEEEPDDPQTEVEVVPATYTIRYLDGIDGTDIYEPDVIPQGDGIIIEAGPTNVPAGKEFVGWSTNPNATADDWNIFHAGELIVPESDMTFYPVWKDIVVKTITVTWIDGYTHGNIKQEIINEGASIPANPTAPNHESDGYRFTGWSNPEEDSDGNITITANYEPIPAGEKINVTWVDGYNGDILKELPGVYDKGTTTIPDDQYPAAPAHAGYTFEQWTTQVLGNGDIIITANYRTLVVNPQGPSFEDLTNLDITVEVECETNATHGPRIETYPLMEGSYETVVTNGSCALTIYNDLYVDAYGGDHSLVGQPAKTIMLEYVIDEPAPQNEDAGEIDEADSVEENADDAIDNEVDNGIEAPNPDGDTDTGSENGGTTDAGNGESEFGDDNAGGNTDLSEDSINVIQADVFSYAAPVTGRWVIANGSTNTVRFTVRCEAPAAQTHTVTWENWNGNLLERITVENGVDVPSSAYTGSTPTRPADGQYTYTFTGWSAPSVDANGNVTYTAQYTPTAIVQTHTVTWLNWNGDQLEQVTVPNGDPNPSYSGTTPTRPGDGTFTYTFTGWSDPSVDADGNVTYVAQYTPSAVLPQTHTVTWLNWNGVQLEQQIVNNGDAEPGYTGTTPARPSDGTYNYTFSGWSAPVVDANGNITYTAQYIPSLIIPEGPDVPVGPVTPVTPTPTPTPTPGGTTTIPDTNPPLADGTTTIDDQEVPLAGAVGLNDTDHFAYIIGYEDDTVRPLNNITRAEVATIFFRLMTDEFRNANWATTNDFSDVTAGSWYNNAISTCANAGALSGYTDGSFKPNASITRAEFAAIAARFLSDEYVDDGKGDFSDTADHWAAKEIRLAAKAGWIQGDGNKFRPNDKITRAEVMTIVNRMLDRVPDADHMLDTMKKWTDNPEDAWYYEAVQEATNEHAYERDEDLGIVETWTEILTVRDWAALEKGWADANAQ